MSAGCLALARPLRDCLGLSCPGGFFFFWSRRDDLCFQLEGLLSTRVGIHAAAFWWCQRTLETTALHAKMFNNDGVDGDDDGDDNHDEEEDKAWFLSGGSWASSGSQTIRGEPHPMVHVCAGLPRGWATLPEIAVSLKAKGERGMHRQGTCFSGTTTHGHKEDTAMSWVAQDIREFQMTFFSCSDTFLLLSDCVAGNPSRPVFGSLRLGRKTQARGHDPSAVAPVAIRQALHTRRRWVDGLLKAWCSPHSQRNGS